MSPNVTLPPYTFVPFVAVVITPSNACFFAPILVTDASLISPTAPST